MFFIVLTQQSLKKKQKLVLMLSQVNYEQKKSFIAVVAGNCFETQLVPSPKLVPCSQKLYKLVCRLRHGYQPKLSLCLI